MKHYLMLKTHNITGLKYLCKTSTSNNKRPFIYPGSGKYWKQHLSKHGRDIKTEILKICNTKEELKEEGLLYSRLWNIVESNDFANLRDESGDGGPTMKGRKITPEQKLKQGKAISEHYKNSSKEYKEKRRYMNSISHEKYIYYTPYGVYTNAFKAAAACNCSNVTIINRCITDSTKLIQSKKYWRFGWRDKTWKELGWYHQIKH